MRSLVLGLVAFPVACASPTTMPDSPSVTHIAEARTLTLGAGPGEGTSWSYRLLVPRDLEPGERRPLLVFLHGAGERGSDNELQLMHLPELFLQPGEAPPFRGFVLAPQCPEGEAWAELDWSSSTPRAWDPEGTIPLNAAWHAVQRTLEEEAIDPHRVHLTGLSMGGYGSFDLAPRHPTPWASITPICGGGDPAMATSFPEVPIWISHGVDDPVVPFARSEQMADALRETGHGVVFEQLPPGTGHAAWSVTYAPSSAWWTWLEQAGDSRAGSQ